MDELLLRNAIKSAITNDLHMNLSYSGHFPLHVLDAMETALVMSITKAIIEYDKLKSETIAVTKIG